MASTWVRATILRGGMVLLAAWAICRIPGQSGEGVLSVEIVGGQPAMVCITALADGSWRTPPDGRVKAPLSRVKDFYNPPPWKPGDIGPVRHTIGIKDGTERLAVYDGLSDYPYWQEPAAYFVSKPFTITLPVGRYRLAVARGLEYLPVFEEFEITPGGKLARVVKLARWVDMPKLGWYSGDDHVHHPQIKPEHTELLLTWAMAEDVHVANILRMGDIRATYFEQSGFGKEYRHQRGDYILAPGQEDPRNDIPEQGHVMGLNITAPVRDTSRYHLYDVMFDGVHQQGGLTGYAHMAWAPEFHRRGHPELNPTWDPSIDAVRSKVDFFEVLQFRKLGLEDFYDFLNLGVKLTASAGSDLPWGNTIGEARVFVYTGRNFSADAWFSALKQGRTFVSNGPMISFTADKAMPGDELRIRKNQTVRVRVRAWAPPLIGTPKKLELISHGSVIASAESKGSSKAELTIDHRLRAGESQWLAARVSCENGAMAHTSPIYILVDGKSFVNRAAAASLVEKRLKILEFIEGRLKMQKFVREFQPGEVDALRARIEEARVRYNAAKGQ